MGGRMFPVSGLAALVIYAQSIFSVRQIIRVS